MMSITEPIDRMHDAGSAEEMVIDEPPEVVESFAQPLPTRKRP